MGSVEPLWIQGEKRKTRRDGFVTEVTVDGYPVTNTMTAVVA